MTFNKQKELIMKELQQVVNSIEEDEVTELVNLLCDARQVFVVGVGRVMLMLQAFVKRLNHIGIEANYVGAINEPAITKTDVLIVGSGSGESIIPLSIAKVAMKYQPKIVHIGSNGNSSLLPYVDVFVRIPCQTKLHRKDEIKSKQLMSSLFEQSLLLLVDAIALEIVEKKQMKDLHKMWQKHANLE